MDDAKKMPKTKALYLCLLGVILGCFVFLAGYSLGSKPAADKLAASFQSGYDTAKQKVEAAGLIPPTVEILAIGGVVTAIGDGSIEIDADQAVTNPLAGAAPTRRRVAIDAATQLTKVVPKTAEEQEKEIAAYESAMEEVNRRMERGEDVTWPKAPETISIEAIELSDLKTGDRVSVTAANDIAMAETFTAVGIQVLPSEVVPPSMTGPGPSPALPTTTPMPPSP